jgi:hypothetical protein
MLGSPTRSFAAVLVSALLFSPPSFAFEAHLSSEAVREAYFLGQRNDETTRAFFEPYLRTFERPKNGPFVSEVEIYTPFSQLVELSSRRNNYSAQQATEDYLRGTDRVFVRIRIQFTPTYGTPSYLAAFIALNGRSVNPPQRANFSHDFRIGLSQNNKWLEPVEARHDLTNTVPTGHFAFDPDGMGSWVYAGDGMATGWLVWLEFDAKDVHNDNAQVEIFGPDDMHLVASFNFTALR